MRQLIFLTAAAFRILTSDLCLNAQPYGMDASSEQRNLGVYAGKVVQIDRVSYHEKSDGSHLLLEMRDRRRVDLSLGPEEYLQDINFTVQSGNEIVVWGHPVWMKNEEIVIVYCIRRGPDKYLFRDAEGVPFWRARRIRFQ